MLAKVCYTLLPKLYHKCKPIATNRGAFPRRPRASSPYRRCTKSDRSHDSSRVQGELRSALRHTLDPAAPTTCDRDSVHRLPTLAEAYSARDDEDSAPPSPPALNSTRNVSRAARKHQALAGGSLPFEAIIARNTIPSIEARPRSPLFQNASRWFCLQRHNQGAGSHGMRPRSTHKWDSRPSGSRDLRLPAIGATLIQLNPNGEVLAHSVPFGYDRQPIRRAQALEVATALDHEVARGLIGQKLTGQRANLSRLRVNLQGFDARCETSEHADSIGQVHICEAQAAPIYWSAWSSVPIRLRGRDLARVPARWAR
jgi:hypothetical protein